MLYTHPSLHPGAFSTAATQSKPPHNRLRFLEGRHLHFDRPCFHLVAEPVGGVDPTFVAVHLIQLAGDVGGPLPALAPLLQLSPALQSQPPHDRPCLPEGISFLPHTSPCIPTNEERIPNHRPRSGLLRMLWAISCSCSTPSTLSDSSAQPPHDSPRLLEGV